MLKLEIKNLLVQEQKVSKKRKPFNWFLFYFFSSGLGSTQVTSSRVPFEV